MIIPNRFGLQRHPEQDLYALPFSTPMSLEDHDFDIINPTYHDGGYYTQTGSVTSNAAFSYCDPVDISAYEYVLIPSCTRIGGISSYSGLRDLDTGSGALNPRILPTLTSQYVDKQVTAWMLVYVGTKKFAFVSSMANTPLPIIGFRKQS